MSEPKAATTMVKMFKSCGIGAFIIVDQTRKRKRAGKISIPISNCAKVQEQ